MSTPPAPVVEQLAFRFPNKVDGCQCPICVRTGVSDESTVYPSPFALYKLVRVEGYSERDPTEEERAAFNAQYPAAAFSRRADEPGGKLPTPWVKAALKLLRQLQKHKAALAFLRPVDPVALAIPDYPSIIRHPMDLATAEAKLLATEAKATAPEIGEEAAAAGGGGGGGDGSYYTRPDDFASDMRMIFRNAFLYNKPDNFVVIAARELSVKFEQGWAQL